VTNFGGRFNGESLSKLGLNLHAVIDIASLPPSIIQQLARFTNRLTHYSQLILIGHAGPQLWKCLQPLELHSQHPFDDYSQNHCQQFFEQRFSKDDFKLIFPSHSRADSQPSLIGLQQLGELVGWHGESPFKVGINAQWGSWFAYRAVVLTKSAYQPSPIKSNRTPCQSCANKTCIPACPADALKNHDLDLKRCIDYRKQTSSLCKDRCLARMACPIATDLQYSLAQIQYHYSQSMRVIESLSK